MARVTEETKICNRCKTKKLAEEFSPHKEGRSSRCRSCQAELTRAWRAKKTPEERAADARRWGLKRMYGMTEEDYEELYELQNGECAICQRTVEGRLHIDHDHSNGQIRGLLCNDCNRGIGLLGDNHERIMQAVIYVTRTMDALGG